LTPFGTIQVDDPVRITSQAQFSTMIVPVANAAGPQVPVNGIE
jgi:hypothetical protein